ncbi:short chain dehydrogenase [Ceratobasidium sp. AG-Ba]|nr:short chain dehydrogenase [Ceratobasidium sp. AG-Ba]QRW10639.1 short chain dehydrogenase [Ceratobasidium sp. AG-Ba]
MPYSERSHSKPIGSLLALASFLRSNLGAFFLKLSPDMKLAPVDLSTKTAIVTGANSGIGFESARALVGMGARVVLACRSEEKAMDAKHKILAEFPDGAVEVEILDCSSFNSVLSFVDRWEKRDFSAVDILINNAGGLTSTVAFTQDGFEYTYQVNHLSHALLTVSLLNRGFMSSHARIVSVSSMGFYGVPPLDIHNCDGSDVLAKYDRKSGAAFVYGDMLELYLRSKACQAVWTMTLQRHLAGIDRWQNISVHACHPGIVQSSIWTQPGGSGSIKSRTGDIFNALVRLIGISNQQGAVVPVWLATASQPASPELRGQFWDRLKWKWVQPWSIEVARQDKLWDKWCSDAKVSITA